VANDLAGAAESGRLEMLLSAPVRRSAICAAAFASAAVEVAAVLALTLVLSLLGSLVAGSGLDLADALAGFAAVWPLALVAAGAVVVLSGFSLRTSVVTGAAAGFLVAMYVVDLVGKLDTGLSGVRYASIFHYYGNAIESGIEPAAFVGLAAFGVLLTIGGAALVERRDIVAD
jgi:ABC-2 type transport system permease protein